MAKNILGLRPKISTKAPVGPSDITKIVKRYKNYLKTGNNNFTLQKLQFEYEQILNKAISHKDFVASTKLFQSQGFLNSEKENIRKKISGRFNEFFLTSNGYDYINGTEKFRTLKSSK